MKKYVVDHDYHVHSMLSSCSSDPEQTKEAILAYGEENGFRDIVVTDHFWDESVPGVSNWYRPQNFAHIREILPLPQGKRTAFHFGAETELPENCVPAASPDVIRQLEFLIIPTTHMHFPVVIPKDAGPEARADAYVKRLEAVLNLDLPFGKVGIAHLTTRLIDREAGAENVLKLIPDEKLIPLFEKAARLGVGIEINASSFDPEKLTPEKTAQNLRVFGLAGKAGCKFYLGSDAHHPAGLRRAREIFEFAVDMLGLTEDQKFIPETFRRKENRK